MKIPAWLLPVVSAGSALFMMGLISAGFLLVNVNSSLPDVETIKGVELKIPLRVYSAQGQLISEFGDERRKPISLEETPATLIQAVLSSEDDRFYEHRGIDFSGLLRAALSNFRSGATQQGASTITMQVARNFFLTREKTYIRKLREVMLAIRLEQILNKDEILHLYLNKIFLGHRAYGFGAAAEVYYGRELKDLSLAEQAMLAGLPKAPSTNNPLRNPDRAIARRNYVLGRMLELGYISDQDHALAAAAPVTAVKHARSVDLDAPHIAEMVRAELLERYGEEAYWTGLSVYTTVQADPQREAERALRAGLQAYDKRHGFRGAISHFDDVAALLESEESAQQLDELMSAFPASHEQRPALITAVEDSRAQAYLEATGFVELLIEDAKWARRHLSANSLGERPQRMGEILTVGDIVYLQPKAETQASSQKDKVDPQAEAEIDGQAVALDLAVDAWSLSQIPNVSGSLISIEPNTGRILSLVGGYDFFLNKYNRAVQSIRQPGSNIKPFIYSAALDAGFLPSSLISGAPIVMTDPTHGTVWRPENYSGKFYGPTRMREALAKSMNLVSIRLLRSIGIPYAREYLSRFGIDMDRFSSSLTMALGSGGITPLELLGAYAVIANGGYRVQPYFIERIVDRHGETVFVAAQPEYCDACYAQYLPQPESAEDDEAELEEAELEEEADITAPAAEALEQEQLDAIEALEPDLSLPRRYEAPRVMNQANNFLTTSMLKGVITRGTARKALALNREDFAGKTGTTNDYVDAWFTGFNSHMATTVWIGFDDPATMGRGEAGSKAALPIWVDYMLSVLDGVPRDSNELPTFMERGWVNRDTGQRTDELDPLATEEFFAIEDLLPEPFGTIGLDAFMSAHVTDEAGSVDPSLEFDGQGALNEGALDEDALDTEEPIVPVQDKIIEDESETEGLF